MRACGATQEACLQPVLKPWLPVTRYPPGTTTACAVGAGVLETTLRGVSIQIERATSRGMRAEKVAKTPPWLMTQPVLASALPSSSMTRM